ncbi:MAG: SLBB domain-containing protein, partial [Thermodesulfobacteriota bacterium]
MEDKDKDKIREETLKAIREGKEISGYIISYGNESRSYTVKIDVGNVTNYRIRGLNNHITYFFVIQAYTRLKEFSEISEEASATPKPEEELLSVIEKGLTEEKISQVISRKIKQFGYDFFRSNAPSFTPLADAPVGPDYIIGPGDRFTISIWGRIEGTFSVDVDRNGGITLPKVGVIKVWGLTFSELKKTIYKRLSKYYSRFQINITMDRLRLIRIFVVGEAINPGSYTLSSVSTVYSALISAGGPSKRGTMRSIQLIRDGNVIKIIDLYDFLLKGDKSQDERLQSGDTIFIPVIGPVVGITGNVKRPAIYELKGPVNLQTMIALAGEVTFLGYLQKIQVERIEAHQKKIIADLDISESLNGEWPQLKTPLQDGDLIKIFPILPDTRGVVYLEGHVRRTGSYEFKEGMKILDLISSFDQLLPEPYFDYAEITRLAPPDFRPEIISFDLGRLLRGDLSENIELKEQDRITIYSREDLQEIPQVEIAGNVQRQGKYPLVGNMRVKDLVYDAGNLLRSAYHQEAEITRLIKTDKGVRSMVININLSEALKENPEHNILLIEDDRVLIRQIPEWYTDKIITIEGEAKFPGVYSFSKGERLSSVLERAGGFSDHAYLKGAFFTRESAKRAQEERLKGFIGRLEEDILNAE